MSSFKNPFTPVIGKDPYFMAGRDAILEDMIEVLEGDGNSPAVLSLYVGPRGAGKTALLSHYANLARQNGWIAVSVTATPGMLEEILQGAKCAAEHLVSTESNRKIKSLSVAKIGSIEWEQTDQKEQSWRFAIAELLTELEKTETGLLITVDEVDPDLPEMEALVTAFQHILDESHKVALAMAGLPYGMTALLSGKSTSFLRRAARSELNLVSDYEVKEALVVTMAEGGKTFEPKALDAAVKAIGGFPYMLQLVGYRTWRIAEKKETISEKDVEQAVSIAQQEIEERVYEATLNDLTQAEKDFLIAMIQDSEITKQADLIGRLDKSSSHVSNYKKRLLRHGVIREKSKGQLEFCLPGFREYLLEEISD